MILTSPAFDGEAALYAHIAGWPTTALRIYKTRGKWQATAVFIIPTKIAKA